MRTIPTAVVTGLVALLELALCLSIFGPQPLAWLWIGSQVNFATDSLSSGLATAFIGTVTTVCITVWLARRIEQTWQRWHPEAARFGGRGLFETAFVVSTVLAVVGFMFWFFVIAGPGPTIAPNMH